MLFEARLAREAAAAAAIARAAADLEACLRETLHGRGRMVFVVASDPSTRDQLHALVLRQAATASLLSSKARFAAGGRAYDGWRTLLRQLLSEPDLVADRRTRDLGRQALQILPADALREQRDVGEFAVFDAVGSFLGYTIQSRAVLLWLEEINGADLPSLRLLHFVARSLHRSPLLIVACHDGLVDPQTPPGSYLTGELARESRRIFL